MEDFTNINSERNAQKSQVKRDEVAKSFLNAFYKIFHKHPKDSSENAEREGNNNLLRNFKKLMGSNR